MIVSKKIRPENENEGVLTLITNIFHDIQNSLIIHIHTPKFNPLPLIVVSNGKFDKNQKSEKILILSLRNYPFFW
ncbi:MAG: hypothetical protein AB9846_12560 [Tenuifilaceae bacterium]